MSSWRMLVATSPSTTNGADVSRIIRTFGADYLLGVFDDLDAAVSYLEPLVASGE